MKNRTIAILILILLVLSSCVGCEFYEVIRDDIQRQHQISKLPDVEYDDDDNIIYNNCIYRRNDNFLSTNYSFDLGKYEYVAKSKGDLIYPYAPVIARGVEDFGEYVYMCHTPFIMTLEYIQSDFVFPDHLNLKIDDVYIERDSDFYNKSILNGESYNNLCLNDILIEVDSMEIANETLLKELRVNVNFADYQSFCLRRIFLYMIDDVVYVDIGYFDPEYNVVHGVYRVNDEYQELFKNAIAELLE